MSERRKCDEVREDLAAIVDGDPAALARHVDHLAECDACRDARHEAAQAAKQVARAGDDFAPPDDLAARVGKALDERAAKAPAGEGEKKDEAPAEGRTKEPAAAEKKGKEPGKPGAPHPAWWAAAAAAVALMAVGSQWIVHRGERKPDVTEPVARGVLHGRLAKVVRAGGDAGTGGIEVKRPGAAAFVRATTAMDIPGGSTVRTDGRTRARIELSDGSRLVLNRATEVALEASVARRFKVLRGELLADVAHLDATPAIFTTETGKVEVLGTRFLLAAAEPSSVLVTRGTVKLHGLAGDSAEVYPGEEGYLPREGHVLVTPAVDMAGSIAWSELEAEEAPDAPIHGVGELRARKPGEKADRDRPLAVGRQKVSVRIVGTVARTEVEQVFRNDSGDVLEGVYRFPLPADAQIERLALEVDGRLEEGVFIDRDRAAKIWRGVIRNATPVDKRKPVEEYIWVPGPWRDPALLEWQQGGRFELKIYPIPARGERRVILAYTQNLAPHGERRRYVYPLAHAGEALRIGSFELDLRLAGHDDRAPVTTRGYELRRSSDGTAARLELSQAGFVPAGDLVLDYALPPSRSPLRWWAFAFDHVAPVVEPPRPTRGTGTASTAADPAILAAERALAGDNRGYVAFAFRPRFAGTGEARARDYVIAVDASQSMVGERYARATSLAVEMVGQMDARDRFVAMACDVTCRAMEGGLQRPTTGARDALRLWLARIRPAGATDLAATLRAATSPSGTSHDRELHVVLIGDGMASIGHRRASALAAQAESLARGRGAQLTTVGIGGDADAVVLSAVARAGGGHFIPYVPGELPSLTALSVLESTYGAALRDLKVELPAGLSDIAPARLPTLRSGEELLVAARLSGEVRGDVVLRGSLAGKPFEERYPVELRATTAGGNAFVPRLWASRQIEQLELGGQVSDVPRIVALSRRHAVMSRHTSLLVLESEAMSKAFGVERGGGGEAQRWTGEESAEGGEAPVESAVADVAAGPSAGHGTLGAADGDALAGAGGARRKDSEMAADKGKAASSAFNEDAPAAKAPLRAAPAGRAPSPTTATPAAEPAPERPMAKSEAKRDTDERVAQIAAPKPRPDTVSSLESLERAASPRRPGRWMKRVWFKTGAIQAYSVRGGELSAVAQADAALAAMHDSRDRHRALALALARAGQLDRARDIAEHWLERDRLDADALTTLSDIIGRQGQRDEALRLLSGIVDLQPAASTLHERLARAYERAGAAERACAHRVALAEILPADAGAVAAAVRCQRNLGRPEEVLYTLDAVGPVVREKAERLALTAPSVPPVRGELIVDASWDRPIDLDVSLVSPQGSRLSWMGGRTTVVAERAGDMGGERLGLQSASTGSYLVEVSRTLPGDGMAVRGRLRIRAIDSEQTLPFTLVGDRVAVGRVDVGRDSRLEAVEGGATVGADRLSREEIVAGIAAVRGRAADCGHLHGAVGTAIVAITISPEGWVSSASVRGAVTSDTPAGRCVEQEVRRARFRRFDGAPMSVTYPIPLR